MPDLTLGNKRNCLARALPFPILTGHNGCFAKRVQKVVKSNTNKSYRLSGIISGVWVTGIPTRCYTDSRATVGKYLSTDAKFKEKRLKWGKRTAMIKYRWTDQNHNSSCFDDSVCVSKGYPLPFLSPRVSLPASVQLPRLGLESSPPILTRISHG